MNDTLTVFEINVLFCAPSGRTGSQLLKSSCESQKYIEICMWWRTMQTLKKYLEIDDYTCPKVISILCISPGICHIQTYCKAVRSVVSSEYRYSTERYHKYI